MCYPHTILQSNIGLPETANIQKNLNMVSAGEASRFGGGRTPPPLNPTAGQDGIEKSLQYGSLQGSDFSG